MPGVSSPSIRAVYCCGSRHGGGGAGAALSHLRAAELIEVDGDVVVEVGGDKDGAQLGGREGLHALTRGRLLGEQRKLVEADDAVLVAVVLLEEHLEPAALGLRERSDRVE